MCWKMIYKDFLVCRPIDDRAMSLEVLTIINYFLKENDINWENCIGLCTDGAQSYLNEMQDFRHWL